MKKYLFVPENLFGSGIRFYLGYPFKEFQEEMKQKHEIEIKDCDSEYMGMQYEFRDDEECKPRMYVLWLREFDHSPKNIAVLVHELSHAVWFILDHKGVKVNGANNEVQAYMLDYFLEKVLIETKQNEKKQSKHKGNK